MSLDKVFRPFAADKHGSHLQEGFVMGWIPGIITSVDDPEKLNRVQCTCPLVDPSLNIPNIDGQWCWRTARFTLSGIKGGSIDPLYEGAQVVLVPMLGDIRYLAVFDYLYSRIDQPSELLDAAKQVYGSVSLHEIMNIHNDREESTILAYPHGVVKSVSGTGDIINQTKQGASTILKEDGTVLVQNPKSSMHLNPQGEISHHAASGAKSILKKDGQVEITNSTGSKLELLHPTTKLVGPKGSLGSLFGKAKGLGGMFGRAMGVVKKLGSLDLDNMVSAIAEGASIYAELSTGLGGFSEAFSSLKEINALPLEDLATAIQPQITSILDRGISQIARDVSQVISEGQDAFAIANGVVGVANSLGVDLGEIKEVIGFVESMAHSPERLIESFVSDFVEDGFEAISQIAGMNLLTNLDTVNNKLIEISDLLDIQSDLDIDLSEEAEDIESKIENLLVDLKKILPWNPSDQQVFSSIESDTPIATLLAYYEKYQIQETTDVVAEFEPLLNAALSTKQVIEGIRDENLYQVFRAANQTNDEELSFADVTLGDYAIRDWGAISLEEATLGDLLGESNPHTFDLEVAVQQLIKSLDLGVVSLQSVGINEIVNVSDLLSMVDLGNFDLSKLMNSIENNVVELANLKIKDILGQITASDIQNVDIDGIKLGNIFRFPDNLDNINIKDIILGDLSIIQDITFKDIYPEIESDIKLGDFLDSYDFGKVDPKEFSFTQVAGIDSSQIDVSAINIPMNVGRIADEHLSQLWEKTMTGLMGKLNNIASKGLELINKFDKIVPSSGGGAKLELKPNLGEVISAWGNSRLFVNNLRVGASSPKGRFGFGSGGGGFFAQGSMAMAVTEKFGRYATGLFLSPNNGVMLSESPKYDYEKSEEWEFSKAKVQVAQGEVRITSDNESNKLLVNSQEISASSGVTQIKISQQDQRVEISSGNYSILVDSNNGIFINDYPIHNLIDLINDYESLSQRLALLEQWRQQQSG